MNVFLVLLEGGGDLYVKPVDQETFDWICSDDMGQPADYDDESEDADSWIDQLVPASQLARMAVEHAEGFKKGWYTCEEFEGVQITRGSWDNDRAIHALPAEGYDTYDTVSAALKAIKKRKDDLQEDEYQGCFY